MVPTFHFKEENMRQRLEYCALRRIAVLCLIAGSFAPVSLSAQGPAGPVLRNAVAPAAPPIRSVVDIGLPIAPPDYRSTVGVQTASLSVDWVAPESILLGQEGLFELVVRNRGRATMEGITVDEALPRGFRLVNADPKPLKEGNQPSWRIERLEPQQEVRIALRLVPEKVGVAQSHARVTFGTSSLADFRVVEPKLQLDVEAPETVIVGNQAIFSITVRNPGSGRASNVKVDIELPPQLIPAGESIKFTVDSLNPGEARSFRVPAKVAAVGAHLCKFIATADNGLRDEKAKRIEGLSAVLELAVTGPNLRYVSRPATYNVLLKNSGTAAAQNVHIQIAVPKAFAFVSSGESGRFDTAQKTLHWILPTLEVGKEFQAKFTLRAESRGDFPILGEAVADRGMSAKAQHLTRVEGIAAILLEVVDIADPIEVGAETTYEILVTNQGTAFAEDVAITATVPEAMEIVAGQGPSGYKIDGRTIRFEVLPKVAPLADAIYRVKVRAKKPGDCRIEVSANAKSLDSPVTELESTKVYEDQ